MPPIRRARLKRWQLRELFEGRGGSSAAVPHQPNATASATGLSLLAHHAGGAVLLHLSPLGGQIPAYLERRAIRSASGAAGADILIFTDVLRTSQVWQWEEPRGDLRLPRECCYLPNGEDNALRRIVRLLDARGSGRTLPAPPHEPPRHPQLERVLVQALLRRILHGAGAAVRAELAAITGPTLQALLDLVATSREPATVRALLRIMDGTPARPAFAVIHPAAAASGALHAAGEALVTLREAALERAAIFIADAAALRDSGRPRHLADFTATLEQADDPSRFSGRRDFATARTLRRNLFASAATAAAGAVLASAVARRLGAERCPPELRFHIRPGGASGGIRDLAGAGLGELDGAAADIHRLAALASGAVGELTPAFAELSRRLDAINLKVTRRSGDGSNSHQRGHWGCDFRPVMRAGGFDVILPGASADV